MIKKPIILIIAMALFALISCKPGEQPIFERQVEESPKKKIMQGDFVHTVLFWMNKQNTPKQNKSFEDDLKQFIFNSKDISSYHLGRPADTYRPIIDTSYNYCLVVTFESKIAHDKYQEDPEHKLFINENEHLWNRVLIYDSDNIID